VKTNLEFDMDEDFNKRMFRTLLFLVIISILAILALIAFAKLMKEQAATPKYFRSVTANIRLMSN
jgi:Tfp pilus assembly protein FimT